MQVLRLTLLFSVWLFAACERTVPSSPSPIGRSVTGAWSGSYVAVCPGNASCGSVGQAPAGAQPLSLTIGQTGDSAAGQINLGGWLPRVASVSGSVSPDGTMTLRGGDSWPAMGFCVPAGGWSIVSWNARYDAQTDLIAGDFAFTTQKHLSSCYYMADLLVNAVNLVLRRGAAIDSSFAGHWQGQYTIVKCTPVGWPRCFLPDYQPPFELRLTQDGSTLKGELTNIPYGNSTPMPVSGSTANSPALILTGVRPQDIGSGLETFRITAWNVSRDEIGRLQGTFSYIDEIQWTGGPNAGTTWSYSYDTELRYVARVPW